MRSAVLPFHIDPQFTPVGFSPRAPCMMSSQTCAAAWSLPRIAWL